MWNGGKSVYRQGNFRRPHCGNSAAQLTIDCDTGGSRGRETIRDSPRSEANQPAVMLKCSFWLTVTNARFHPSRACGFVSLLGVEREQSVMGSRLTAGKKPSSDNLTGQSRADTCRVQRLDPRE